MNTLELGAGASGFQFALAGLDIGVVSVDPLLAPEDVTDWQFTLDDFKRLNRAFGNRVRFLKKHLEDANLPPDEFDRVFSISVIEHIPGEQISPLVREVNRVLKPGGRFLATVDLFLDCAPFTQKQRNRFGENISIRQLVEASQMKLVVGKEEELCGFDAFDPHAILRRAPSLLNIHGVLTQCFVLEKGP
jgi:SAM-dependent methyltransferase